MKQKLTYNWHLFNKTSHSPSLIDIVGEDMASEIIDFCFIANPYFPTDEIMEKMQKMMPLLIKMYPSSNPINTVSQLASLLNVKPEQLIIGNGATELITIIQSEFVHELAIPIPTFSEYTDTLRFHNSVRLFQLPPEKKYALDLDVYAEWITQHAIRSALIINPGNPTGQLIDRDKIIAFISKMSHLEHIIVDESFIDFAHDDIPSLIPYINDLPNVIIIRSMSKHCGVPGLRLGYCCSSRTDVIARMNNLVPLWNINTLAEYFLSLLVKTNDVYHEMRKRVIVDVQFLFESVRSIPGFYVYKTGSNFVMIKIECGFTALEIQRKLLEEYQVYVRDCSNKIGLDSFHIRVSSQGKQKDAVLVAALQSISKEVYG
ncbi:MAG: pyridoxal phosphate-dependent aminotransferase [Bacteroidota bacterium]